MTTDSPSRLLRLTQVSRQESTYTVTIRLEQSGSAPREASSTFDFDLTDRDREDIRWYLEEYLLLVADEANQGRARLIEARMESSGTTLFEGIFGEGDAQKIWHSISENLEDTRLEIQTEVLEAASIPWELLQEPGDKPVPLRTRSFVRAIYNASRAPILPEIASESDPLRILLVICRPNRSEDVPFRSVASRLLKALDETQTKFYQLDLLRPPTFERLAEVLRAAKDENKPYHIVHFDGHGAYMDLRELLDEWNRQDEDKKKIKEWLAKLLNITPSFLTFHRTTSIREHRRKANGVTCCLIIRTATRISALSMGNRWANSCELMTFRCWC